jgi:hypothetical protein
MAGIRIFIAGIAETQTIRNFDITSEDNRNAPYRNGALQID